MAVSTVSDICRGALQAIGVLAAGETLDASDGDIALEVVNGWLDQKAAERLAIYESARTTWTISNTASFTLGTGGTINVIRPQYIDHVRYQDTSASTPTEIELTELSEDAYALYPQKTETANYPAYFYYDHSWSSGLANLYLLPRATGSNLQGVLYAPKQIARFAALTTSFSLPPGYERMIRMNLALELCGPFEKQPPPWVVAAADDSLQSVRRANLRVSDLSVDAQLTPQTAGRYNIYSDT